MSQFDPEKWGKMTPDERFQVLYPHNLGKEFYEGLRKWQDEEGNRKYREEEARYQQALEEEGDDVEEGNP